MHPDHLLAADLSKLIALAEDWQAHRTIEALSYREPRDMVQAALAADLTDPMDAEGLELLRARIARINPYVFRDAAPYPFLHWENRRHALLAEREGRWTDADQTRWENANIYEPHGRK